MQTPPAASGLSHRRRERADFLRSRRERLAPGQVGLPAVGRRRTPGLRREEVAQLAGVGVTWYTWLEQARDINVSGQVLDALARTLRLDQRERAHLFALSSTVDSDADAKTCAAVSAGFQDVLDQLSPLPAVVRSWRYDLLAYNRGFRFLIGDLDAVPPEDRNLLWLYFSEPSWQRALEDWDLVAPHLVGKLRVAMTHHLDDPLGIELVERLRRVSPLFERLWAAHDVAGPPNEVKRYRTAAGLVRLRPHILTSEGGATVQFYSSEDAETLDRLEQLASTRP